MLPKTYKIKTSFFTTDGVYSGEAGTIVTKEFYDKFGKDYADRLEISNVFPNVAKTLEELKAEFAEIGNLIKEKEAEEKEAKAKAKETK